MQDTVCSLRFSFIAALIIIALSGLIALYEAHGDDDLESAIFAGGCFWCVESDFDSVEGVVTTTSGYIGGHVPDPTYKQVSRGGTGHLEAVKIEFNPALVSYEELLHLFWRSVDPTDAGGQFCDRGESYTTAVFATTEGQLDEATASKKNLVESLVLRGPIVTTIRERETFYDAEDYHQDYYKKNPIRYKYYRGRCGRDKKVAALWGDEAWAAGKH